jgi:hypothetical protein
MVYIKEIWKVSSYNPKQSLTPSNEKRPRNVLIKVRVSMIIFGGLYMGYIWRKNMRKPISQPTASQTPSNKTCNSFITIYRDSQIQDRPYAYAMLIKHRPINFMGPYGFLKNSMVVKHYLLHVLFLTESLKLIYLIVNISQVQLLSLSRIQLMGFWLVGWI